MNDITVLFVVCIVGSTWALLLGERYGNNYRDGIDSSPCDTFTRGLANRSRQAESMGK